MTFHAADRIYLARACELAARGVGNVSPNPPVGAVIVADGRIIGEGFHHLRGEAHAEVEALLDAQARGHAGIIAGATMYVSLEPCNHHGRTPPCSEAVVTAGLARVVIGTLDPNPRTALGGVTRLSQAGIVVDIVDDAWARELIRKFTVTMRLGRPYVTLKLAASLDGFIAPQPGMFWLTGTHARTFVHDLRAEHDGVIVGAHTATADDPLLTIRPPRARRRSFSRIVICGATPPDSKARVFAQAEMTMTVLLVPGAYAKAYAPLSGVADVVIVGDERAREVDLHAALACLRQRDIASVLCEGGPTLAAALLAANLVDRVEWLLTPHLLSNAHAQPVLHGNVLGRLPQFRFDDVQRLGNDIRVSIDLEKAHV